MPQCTRVEPGLYPVEGALVRCLLYTTGGEEAASD
jgi:hypothetical protein